MGPSPPPPTTHVLKCGILSENSKNDPIVLGKNLQNSQLNATQRLENLEGMFYIEENQPVQIQRLRWVCWLLRQRSKGNANRLSGFHWEGEAGRMCDNYRRIHRRAAWILQRRHDHSCGRCIFPMDRDNRRLSGLDTT